MNITEFMDFDFAWFTTLPGILITGGVVVLLVALIIFIASNKKDKKNKTPEVAAVDNNMNVANDGMNMGMPLNDLNNGIDMNMQNSAVPSMDFSNNELNNSNMGDINSMNNDINNGINSNANDNFYNQNFNNSVDMNGIPTINNSVTPNYNSVTPTNVVDFTTQTVSESLPVNNNFGVVNSNDELQSQNNTINSNVEIPSVPSYNENINLNNSSAVTQNYPEVNVAPVVNDVPSTTNYVVQQPETVAPQTMPTTAEVKPSIYGGVDPANIMPTHEEVKPVIYGGADPLEHTATLPTMTHEAYNIPTSVTPETTTTVEMTPRVEPMVQQTEMVEPKPMPVTPEPVMPSVMPAVEPSISPMPMTGAEMFNTSDSNGNNELSNGNSEIETLEF